MNTLSNISTVDRIRAALSDPAAGFHPHVLEIIDQSHGHLHHAGRGNGGHFKLKIVSEAFANKTLVQRHQLIYQALGDLMKDAIHAISIEARAPNE